MYPEWEDYTSKYGFGDGDRISRIDILARDLLCKRLNKHPALQEAGLEARQTDRPGVHNFLFITLEPKGDNKQRSSTDRIELPEKLQSDIDEMIRKVYEDLEECLELDFIEELKEEPS